MTIVTTRAAQVFVSYPWDPNTDPTTVAFVEHLQRNLTYLPDPFRALGRVSLWFDRQRVHGRSSTFSDQTVPACQASDFALFLLNPKWFLSPGCQAEAEVFKPRNGALDHSRVLLIQLSDQRQNNPSEYQGPSFPTLWKQRYGNLLELWEGERASGRDAFVSRIRDEICASLLAQREPVTP